MVTYMKGSGDGGAGTAGVFEGAICRVTSEQALPGEIGKYRLWNTRKQPLI